MRLPELSIHKPITVIMVFVALMVVGGIAWQKIPLEFLPDMESPKLWVWVETPNSNAWQVEKTVAIPAEEMLSTVRHLKSIHSLSTNDSCNITLEFHQQADMDFAHLEVRDRLERLRADFPEDFEEFDIHKHSTSEYAVLWFYLFWDGPPEVLYELAQDRLVPLLERIDGVARIDFWGLEDKKVFIDLDQQRLKAHKIDPYQLILQLNNSSLNLSGGFVEEADNKYLLRVLNRYESLEDIAEMPLGKKSLKLKDVAQVRYGYPEKERIGRVDGGPALSMAVLKEARANTIDVCTEAKKAIERFKTQNPLPGLDSFIIFDQSQWILNSFSDLKNAGKWGAFFSCLVLFFFLRHIRATLLITLSVPFSILMAVTFLYFMKRSLNVVSLAGLMLAVGMLVDNAVVVVENISRHLQGGSRLKEAARKGAGDVSMALLASTLTTCIVFLPAIFLEEGEMRHFMREAGLALTLSLLASLFMALSLIPLVSTTFLSQARKSLFLEKLVRAYPRLLSFVIKRPFPWIILLLLLLTFTYYIPYKRLGQQEGLMADTRQTSLYLDYDTAPTVEKAEEVFKKVEKAIMSHEEELEIEHIFSWSSPFSRRHVMTLFLKERDSSRLTTMEVTERLREYLPEVPGVRFVMNWRRGRDEGDSSVEIDLLGDDVTVLSQLSQEVVKELEGVEGLRDVRVDEEQGMEEVQMMVDRTLSKRLGFSTQRVAMSLAFALKGRPLPDMITDSKRIEVVAQLREEDRENLNQLQDLWLQGEEGKEATLREMVNVSPTLGPKSLERLEGRRTLTVKANVADRPFSLAAEEVKDMMEDFPFPKGYSYQLGKSMQELKRSRQALRNSIIMAIVLIYLLLGALFESFLHPFTIIVTVPLAMMGSLWLMYVTQTPMDVMAFIGLVLLIGVVVNNAIVMVDHINTLRKGGMEPQEAVLQGSHDRLRPVLMTSLTTILGLLPLAFGSASLGREYMFYPLGRTVIGGMVSSTLLTLLFIPLLYLVFERLRLYIGGQGLGVGGQ